MSEEIPDPDAIAANRRLWDACDDVPLLFSVGAARIENESAGMDHG